MKKVIFTAATMLVAGLVLSACGKKDDNAAPIGAQAAARAQGTYAQPTGIQLAGQLTGTDANSFQNSVIGLCSSVVPVNYVGSVDPSASNGTGIFFGARVSAVNGAPITAQMLNSQQQIPVSTSSDVYIEVVDQYAAQYASQGDINNMSNLNGANSSAVPPIPFHLTSAQGYIGGGQVDVIFTDSDGTMEFRGSFNGTNITGQMQFQNRNFCTAPGQCPMGQGASGVFQFSIAPQYFFH
jgi:hypothetical protein